MRDDKVLRVLRPSLALAALAAVVVLLGVMIAGPAHAATRSPQPEASTSAKAGVTKSADPSPASPGAIVLQRGSEVRFGEDVVVPKGTGVPSVVVFGGDILVNGRVTDSVVAFGGNVTINGTVGTSTVAFGGDVTLGPNAVLGRELAPTDASLVLFGGALTQAPGAEVVGEIQQFTGLNWGDAIGWVGEGALFNPLLGLSFFGWLVQTAFFLVLALVAAALMPRQLRGVQRQVGRRPWASLGWGALTFFVALPAILIILVISIIGLLLVIPYGLFVLLAYFFVTAGVAAFLAQKVLTGFGGKENLMLAVVVGVVGTTVVSRIPVVGPLLLTAMMVIGTGAAILGVAEWRRDRRTAAAAQAAAAAAATGVAPAAETIPQPAVITPIVQTSPSSPAETATPAAASAAESTPATMASGDAAEGETAVTQAPAPEAAPEAPAAEAAPAAPDAEPAPEPDLAAADERAHAAPQVDDEAAAPQDSAEGGDESTPATT
jgi:hypothetical protein